MSQHIVDIQLEYGQIFDYANAVIRLTSSTKPLKYIQLYRERYVNRIKSFEDGIEAVKVDQDDAEWWKQLRRSKLLLVSSPLFDHLSGIRIAI